MGNAQSNVKVPNDDLQQRRELAQQYLIDLAPTVPEGSSSEYVRFLAIKAAFDDLNAEKFSPPSAELDEEWHKHILDTQAYAKSMEVLGKFINHNPRGADNVQERDARVRRFLFMYEQVFGSDDASRRMYKFVAIFTRARPPANQKLAQWAYSKLWGRTRGGVGTMHMTLPRDATLADAHRALTDAGFGTMRLIWPRKGNMRDWDKKLEDYGPNNESVVYMVPSNRLGC